METVEESSLVSYDNVKENVSLVEIVSDATDEVQPSAKTNGITSESYSIEEQLESRTEFSGNGDSQCTETASAEVSQEEYVAVINRASETTDVVDNSHVEPPHISENNIEETCLQEEPSVGDACKESENPADSSTENVLFETEVVVENDVTDTNQITIEDHVNKVEGPADSSELDAQQIELNAAIISSVEIEPLENNNSNCKSEVLNNEELLDILEGNDVESTVIHSTPTSITKQDAAKLALEQLSQLSKKKGRNSTRKKRNSHKEEKKDTNSRAGSRSLVIHKQKQDQSDKANDSKDETHNSTIIEQEKEHIVSALFKDWDDDDIDEADGNKISEPNQAAAEDEVENKTAEIQENLPKEATVPEHEDSLKPSDESIPQRRLSRVIKKKVIFDPDNPDTFTKGKSAQKTKEVSGSPEKEHSPAKKAKTDESLSDKSKSPVGKNQWKKPTPKAHKNFKRLSEVDRLLMDEGAVNMIYQVTPEVSKGKRNMKTKAELIKKLNQSSTPEQKEKNFRERKIKTEEPEPKKIIGGKHRSSGSIKSAALEDFDAHSADDSIIYRRHSSSSYSSSCMSPRRLSEIDIAQNVSVTTQPMEVPIEPPQTDIFMAADVTSNIIKKQDCLSLKEKLNSKLNNILKKRKSESQKTEKPSKQKKKVSKPVQKTNNSERFLFETLVLSVENGLAIISWDKTDMKDKYLSSKMFLELQHALEVIDERSDTSVTLLNFQPEEIFSSGLDLHPLLEENMDKRTSYALQITSSVQNLLLCMRRHHKLLVGGVTGWTAGVGLSLLLMCDVVIAAETASFGFTTHPQAAILPGGSVLTSNYRQLPRNLVSDMVVFGRHISPSEACAAGLVSRTALPFGFYEYVRTVAADLAAQPMESVLIKKHQLNIKCGCESELASFTTSLSAEQDLFVEYWTSVAGQELLRNILTEQE